MRPIDLRDKVILGLKRVAQLFILMSCVQFLMAKSAFAEWVKTGTPGMYGQYYYDKGSIIKNKHGFTVKVIVNVTNKGVGAKFRHSLQNIFDIDCGTGESRSIHFSEFSDLFGRGEMTRDETDTTDKFEKVKKAGTTFPVMIKYCK